MLSKKPRKHQIEELRIYQKITQSFNVKKMKTRFLFAP